MIKYSIITPLKNEIDYIEKTIHSVTNQLFLPEEWIIIDDNSNDGSELIIENAAMKFSWIKIFRPTEYKLKDYSSRVVYLFNYGYSKLTLRVNYVSKLDADVSFAPNFYKNIILTFEKNSALGIASGHLTQNNIPEKVQHIDMVCTRGATKVYRVKCLEDIGGIVCFQGWDSLDNVAARAKGWHVAVLPEYFEHLKEEGSKVGNRFYRSYRTGYYNGAIPYFFPYFIIKALSKLIVKPILIGAILQIIGYLKSRFIDKLRPYDTYIVTQLVIEQKRMLKRLFIK
jgi:glycosyltransferase involved in cell wall biosynthesis